MVYSPIGISFLLLQGNLVTALGHSSDPWLVTATLAVRSAGSTAQLVGNVTLPFEEGWANFTNLAITKQGSGYELEFAITHPQDSSVSFARSTAFPITPRQLTGAQADQTGRVYANEAFQVLVEVRDAASGEVVTNLEESVSQEKNSLCKEVYLYFTYASIKAVFNGTNSKEPLCSLSLGFSVGVLASEYQLQSIISV